MADLVDVDANAAWSNLLGLPADACGPEVCAAFEMFVPTLAPELNELPVYCLPTSSLPPEYQESSRWRRGWMSPTLYAQVRPFLPARAPFGAATIVVDRYHADELEEIARRAFGLCPERLVGETVESLAQSLPSHRALREIASILTHELAHIIQHAAEGDYQLWETRLRRDPSQAIEQAEAHDHLVQREIDRIEAPEPRVDCHGPDFTRVAAHLDVRLQKLGVPHHNYYAAGEQFNQPPFEVCAAELSEELADTWSTDLVAMLAEQTPALT